MTTTREYVPGVRRYASRVNVNAIGRIIRHLGIALTSRDGSRVSVSDKTELDRVRDRWLRKKLGLSANNLELDQHIDEVCNKMRAERSKCRVVFYYLLAEKFDKLDAI